MSPKCVLEKGNGRVEAAYEPEQKNKKRNRSHRRSLRAQTEEKNGEPGHKNQPSSNYSQKTFIKISDN